MTEDTAMLLGEMREVLRRLDRIEEPSRKAAAQPIVVRLGLPGGIGAVAAALVTALVELIKGG